ncbi:YciI family protein [Alteromonas gilva]|uniref:YciI family protein n=1 Tax=Alteromonas gilva TaxID=2987522 RepID=A0ABT5L2H7_9ALTE|nr:YciI family protein [Alteromonas gilva]MDC8831077.1 YciI family protein [Alteromonas gilva]
MQYMLLIYGVEGADDVDMSTLLQQYAVFSDEAAAAGVLISGEGLEPVSTATSVRVRDGEISITDGPFAETKEALGGYYLLDCDNLDVALHWAAKIPSARYGTVEVRPVMAYE